MTFELGPLKFNGERFFVYGKYIKFSRMRFKILKMLCQNHNIRPVGYPEIIAELYYDLDYIKDEPDSQSYKVVIYLLRKQLRSAIGDKLLITAHKGRGLMIELNELYREGYE